MDDARVYIKKSKTKKKRISILPTLTLFMVVIGFGVSSYLAYDFAVERNKKFEAGYEVSINKETAVEFRIPYNASTDDIAKLLLEKDLIKSITVYKVISNIFGYDGSYTSGTHLLNKDMKYEDIMIVLTSQPEIIRVTFPEGFTVQQIKERLAANGLVDPALFDETVKNISLDGYKEIDPGNSKDSRLEGYLFPDTYEFDKNAGEEFIINRLLKRFDQLFDNDMRLRAEQMGKSVDEIIIMASLLEKEASTYDERRKVAGVFYNRLNSDDASLHKLQSCATLQYIIVKNGGEVKQTITEADERIYDRYNTYLFAGLPPGAICNPGLESIMAALYPEDHDFYFFVLDPAGTGKHIFTKTYEEHVAAGGG
jgi:UPF0755 protein